VVPAARAARLVYHGFGPLNVSVDSDRCTGHARCAEICPTVFSSDDDGFAVLLVTEVPTVDEAAVFDAVAGCPESAIRVVT
jgi:ferredoxin